MAHGPCDIYCVLSACPLSAWAAVRVSAQFADFKVEPSIGHVESGQVWKFLERGAAFVIVQIGLHSPGGGNKDAN